MPNTIIHKKSSTPGAIPAPGSLAAGELAVNTADGVVYLKKDDGTVVASGGTATGAAGGDLAGAYPNPQIAAGAVTLAKTTGIQKTITSGTAAPTGGSDGDIYLQYT